MTADQKQSLNNFLAFTNVEQLGEGDVNAGANLLAATACTIANIAPLRSAIVSPDGSKVKVGSSLLVNGSLSSNLIRDQVSSELTNMQNNWIAQLRRAQEDITKEVAKPGMKSFNFPIGPRSSDSENTFLTLQQQNPILWDTLEDEWVKVITSPPTPKLIDMTAAPKVVVTATDGPSLKKQLIGLYRHRPLVIMGLNAKSGSPQLAEICTALMNGSLPAGVGVETIDGNMLLLDSENRLPELAESSQKHDIRWLGNMPWLIDGDVGPEAEPTLPKNKRPINQVAARINQALQYAMANRLRNDKTHPTVYKVEFTAAQKRWIQFLMDMKSSLPGITGAARQLLATLVFGLHEITHVRGFKNVQIHISYIENFARHLILRMANARNAIYTDADAECRSKLMRNILVKLQDGGQVPRDIYRALSIKSELCHDIMYELATKKFVQKSGNEWELTQKAIPLLHAGAITQLTV